MQSHDTAPVNFSLSVKPSAVSYGRRRQTSSRTGAWRILWRSRLFVTAAVATGVGANVIGTADGQASGVTAFDHHKALAVVLVDTTPLDQNNTRVMHLLVRNKTTVARRRSGHSADLGTSGEFDGITVEIARVDLESVDLDDCPVLGITSLLLPAPTLMGGEMMIWPRTRLSEVAQRVETSCSIASFAAPNSTWTFSRSLFVAGSPFPSIALQMGRLSVVVRGSRISMVGSEE